MKVQGTKPVKDEGSGDQVQTDEPAHKSDWRAELEAACEKVFSLYVQTTHATWQQLYDDVCERYGERLAEYDSPERMLAYERIATNTLIAANKAALAIRD